MRYDRGMAAHPLVIPSSKFTSYSDAFFGSAVTATKQLLSLGLPIPASIFLPPSTLELFYQSSPQRQRVIDQFRQLIDVDSDSSLTKKATQLKQTIATLAINRQLVYALTDWYHDNLGGGGVTVTASHWPNLNYQPLKGNVNLLESILHVWANSVEACFLRKNHSPQSCLIPTGIFIQSQPKVDLSGVLFTNHPQKLTKASLVVYLWQKQFSQQQPPDETIDLDMRSGMILKRQSSTPASTKPPIALTTNQLSTLVASGSRVKQHNFQDTTIQFLISNQQVLFTQIPANYHLELPKSQATRTVTKLLLHTELASQVKRVSKISDGVGILEVDWTKRNPKQLIQTIQSLFQLSPTNQTLLLQPKSINSYHNWSRLVQLFEPIKKEINYPIALLPSQLKIPGEWLALTSLPLLKASLTQPKLLWLEIATPAMALALRSLDFKQIGGIVINQSQLISWAMANQSSNKSTKHDEQLSPHAHFVFAQLLDSILTVVRSQVVANPIPVWVEVDQADQNLITTIVNSGCQAILSSASELSTIKDGIRQAEKEIWKSRM